MRSVAIGLLALLPVTAHASPRWSGAPRWTLSGAKPPACPDGWQSDGRVLRRRHHARCAVAIPPPVPPRPVQTSPRRTRVVPPWHGLDLDVAPVTAPPRAPAPPRADDRFEPMRGPDATKIMALSPRACHAFLEQHDVPFVPVRRFEARRVAQPIRLSGPLAGVIFEIPWSKDMSRDKHAIWDCRLAAAMIPLASWLSAQGVQKVQYFSVLRYGSAARRKPRSQHNVGLAIDVLALVDHRGDRRVVETNYAKGRLVGCPPPHHPSRTTRLYWSFVCQIHRSKLAHTVLTPDYDRAHRNHLHIDIKARQRAPADPFVSYAAPASRAR